MKNKFIAILLFLYSSSLFAQQTAPPSAADPELTDLFLTYWPVIFLPIFMIVIWSAYRRRNRRGK